LGYAHAIKKYVVEDSIALVHDAASKRKNILLEGAQGTMLDVDHGTYPYVTSSNPTSGGACVGSGLPPKSIETVLGVVKAYTTRVGGGPFPTETDGDIGEKLREIGHEYGATTGRPRRCGWFDGVVMRHASRVNGLTHLAVTKLDVLDSFDTIQVCTAYKYNGGADTKDFPLNLDKLEGCKPVYEEMPGWKQDITKVTDYSALPVNAKKYLDRLAQIADAPISMVSVGAERTQIIKL
jgi:adenylosuccinate synthase